MSKISVRQSVRASLEPDDDGMDLTYTTNTWVVNAVIYETTGDQQRRCSVDGV